MKILTASVLFAALLLGMGSREVSAQDQKKGPSVDLEVSFQIPQSKGGGISHTPSVIFSRNGKRMLTATSNNEIVVFDAKTRKIIKRIQFPGKGSDGVSIDPSGGYAVWVRSAGGVAVMNLTTEKIIAHNSKLRVKWVAVSSDAKSLAISHGSMLQIRDLVTLKLVQALPVHKATITNLMWSRDGRLLGSTAADGRLVVWEISRNRKFFEKKQKAALYALDFDPTGRAVAYGGYDKKVYEYDFSTEKEVVISKNQPFWITCLGYSPDGTLIAVGDESCDIWLYQVKTKERTFHNKHHVECWLSNVAWASDNKTFLFGCRPNSHAGRPNLHATLLRTEAARTLEARRSRKKLIETINARLKDVTDQKGRASLLAYRKTLQAEDRLDSAMSLSLQGFDEWLIEEEFGESLPRLTFNTETNRALIRKPQVSTTFQGLPKDIQKLAKVHQKMLEKEINQLRTKFCVNQWRVKKK